MAPAHDETPAKNDPPTNGEPVPHTEYHRDGTVRAQGQKVNGELHGYWEWFRLDGTVMRSGTFAAGEQIGEWITYDTNGIPYKTTVIKPK
jgi:antitoxin component YwqK of YwqJK toxin-antitoxin module